MPRASAPLQPRGQVRAVFAGRAGKLLARRPGGGTGGTRLTSEGRAVPDRSRRFRRDLDPLTARRFTRAVEER
jgi:hypothetical protein